MAHYIDPKTGTDIQHCVVCGVNHVQEGITCPNARECCIDHCGCVDQH